MLSSDLDDVCHVSLTQTHIDGDISSDLHPFKDAEVEPLLLSSCVREAPRRRASLCLSKMRFLLLDRVWSYLKHENLDHLAIQFIFVGMSFVLMTAFVLATAILWRHPSDCVGSCLEQNGPAAKRNFSCGDDIDVVFMWINGSDPMWLAKIEPFMSGSDGGVHGDNNKESRYADYGSLKYALRSVEKNMPFVRHVWIVTDNQVPSWLDTSQENVTVVDHTEIVPGGYLPLFNAAAIENYLYRIPNLSECFIYMNDDFLVLEPTIRSNFVLQSGHLVSFVEDLWGASADYTSNKRSKIRLKKTTHILKKKYPNRQFYVPAHAPYVTSRTIMQEIHDKWPSRIQKTSLHPIRTDDEFIAANFFHMHYANRTGRGKYDLSFHHAYVPVGNWQFVNRFFFALVDLLRPKVIVANDARTIFTPDTLVAFLEFVERRFPQKSSLEK